MAESSSVMSNPPTVILSASPKGGCGKTTVTDATASVSVASGHSTLVVDVDDGNSGYRRRAGKGAALSLSWTTTADRTRPWLAKNVYGKDVVIFDLGANLVASESPVTEFLGEAILQLKATGSRIVFFAIASPNAPGTGRLIRSMRDDYSSVAEVYIVENNVDGSNAFPENMGTFGITTIPFPHMDPGIQAVRMLREEPLLEVFRAPSPGYEVATARYAQKVASFAKQEAVRGLFGDDGLPEFQRLAAAAPGGLRYAIGGLRGARNEAIRANERLLLASREVRSADRTNRELVYAKAIELIDAEAAYRAI
ncbi:hypothetical protein E2493_16675 [Sphingomonas parva]|uniref:ParA family protein n=1 Tax=Sphingomonas parva TaxID=2555898 RepID=A0A4Y8ZMA6_9SPHN|nr:hypothetical protein [Sphingomonas parva]TFI57143.1 hypothetical protein E2493_16675 [Sphingomonas parva]